MPPKAMFIGKTRFEEAWNAQDMRQTCRFGCCFTTNPARCLRKIENASNELALL